jgi:hypothetical protein
MSNLDFEKLVKLDELLWFYENKIDQTENSEDDLLLLQLQLTTKEIG